MATRCAQTRQSGQTAGFLVQSIMINDQSQKFLKMDSWLLKLPAELIDGIIDNLGIKDVLRLSCVSKFTLALCKQEPVWLRKWLYGQPKRASFKVIRAMILPEEDAEAPDADAMLCFALQLLAFCCFLSSYARFRPQLLFDINAGKLESYSPILNYFPTAG